MPTFPAYITATIAPRSRYIVGTPGSATLQVFAEPPVLPSGVNCGSSVGAVTLVRNYAELAPSEVSSASVTASVQAYENILIDIAPTFPQLLSGNPLYPGIALYPASLTVGPYAFDSAVYAHNTLAADDRFLVDGAYWPGYSPPAVQNISAGTLLKVLSAGQTMLLQVYNAIHPATSATGVLRVVRTA
jgi:hypothetical protein